jgi:hypothetical protein
MNADLPSPPDHKLDCRTHTGTAVHLTAGVHCCACWQSSNDRDLEETKVRAAVDILQTSGIKGDAVSKAAADYLARTFGLLPSP